MSPLKTLFPWAFYAKPGESAEVTGLGEVGGPPMESTKEFVIFRGMDMDAFRSVIRHGPLCKAVASLSPNAAALQGNLLSLQDGGHVA